MTQKYGLTLKYAGMEALPKETGDLIIDRVAGFVYIDKNNEFVAAGEPRKAVAVVVSPTPFVPDDDRRGFLFIKDAEFTYHLGYEDEAGTVHDVRDCKELMGSRHVYGCVFNRPSDGTSWIFVPKAGDEYPGALISAAAVKVGEYVPIPVEGQTDYCADHYGRVSELGVASDGEFVFSDEERVTILGIPFYGENEDQELIEALGEALLEYEARLSVEIPLPGL